jgi:hypothetical protein
LWGTCGVLSCPCPIRAVEGCGLWGTCGVSSCALARCELEKAVACGG